MISNEVKIQAGSLLGVAGVMTWLNCRPLGIVFLSILIAFSYKQIFPAAKLQVPYEVQSNVKSLVENFSQLRKDKPGAFCVIVSGGMVTLAIAGQVIPGTWLVLGTLACILFVCAKYNIKLIHNGDMEEDDHVKNLTDTGEKKSPPWNGGEYEVPDEFLPDVSDEMNASLLKQVAEDADVSNYLYKTNTKTTTGDDDKEDSDSEVPSDLLLTSDKIPEIEDEEVTYASGFSPMDEKDIELPRTTSSDIKVTYDPFSEDGGVIEFTNSSHKQLMINPDDSSEDSDDSISRGLNFQDVSLPDASGSGAKGFNLTSSGSSFQQQNDMENFPLSSSQKSVGATSSQAKKELLHQQKNNSPTWNIVNNLWDAVNSSVIPQQQIASEPAIITTTTTVPPPQQQHASKVHRKSVTAELSSDESDFELLDTDDLNINT